MQRDRGSWPAHPVMRRVRRRLSVANLLESSSLGLVLGAVAASIFRLLDWSGALTGFVAAAITLATGAAWYYRSRPGRRWTAAAQAIERTHPHCRNVVVTAIELTGYPDRASEWVRRRVLADAEAVLGQVDSHRAARLRRSVGLFAMSAMSTLAIAAVVYDPAREFVRTTVGRVVDVPRETPSVVAITLAPPAYTRQPVTHLSNPERIDALEGTRLRVEIPGGHSNVSVRFESDRLPTTETAGLIATELVLRRSGYLAVDLQQRVTLIPVTVAPDRPPTIRVERPGKDLLLPNTASSIGVEARVSDDYGVADLRLRYTRASGYGEQFTFREGEIPLAIGPRDRAVWRGRGTFVLSRLGLQPGDSLIYSFIARDERAGAAGTSESDTFFIEIAGPGQVAFEGAALPPDRDRYALSQQMIVLKIEHLRGREQQLSRDAVEQQSADIGAEQRAVKANFIFLMGGQVEDEEVEAEQSTEIQEGRLQNTARRDIGRAIDHMTRTEESLARPDTASALRQARLAVDSLQLAFGQNRYLLRTLATRDSIDPSRRLTGKLEGARSSERTHVVPESNQKANKIRDLFNSTTAVLNDLADGRSVEATLSALSERSLAVDPADANWQRIARQLNETRDRVGEQARHSTVEQLQEILRMIVAEAQRVALAPDVNSPGVPRLRGTWADELAVIERGKR